MSMTNRRTIRIPKKYGKTLGLEKFPKSGPGRTITELRYKWGGSALIVRLGQMAYSVDEDTFKEALKHGH